MSRNLTRGETSRLLRAALKSAFPGVTFRVQSRASAIHVSWTDGPTWDQVDKVTYDFRGCNFDPMQDLQTIRETTLNGEPVVHGASYICLHRSFSVPFFTAAIAAMAQRLGEDVPPVGFDGETAYLDYPASFKWDHQAIWVRDRLIEAANKTAA